MKVMVFLPEERAEFFARLEKALDIAKHYVLQ